MAVLCSFSLWSCTSDKQQESAQQKALKTPSNVVPVSAESAQQLDLKTAPVERRSLATSLRVTGRIQAEVAKEIDVSPRFTARTVALLVKQGDRVTAGQTLAKVESQDASEMQAELIEAQSKYQIAKAHEERETQIYQERLQRPKELLSAQSDYQQMKVKVQLAEAEFKRASELHKEKIVSAKDFQAARAKLQELEVQLHEADLMVQREQSLYKNKGILMRDLQLARAETTREKQHVETLKQRLVLLGMPMNMVSQMVTTGKIVEAVPIVSPITGVVTDLKTGVGEMVSSDKKMLAVTDLSEVVMTADIPEVDIAQIRPGEAVDIKVEAYPKETFHGTISFVSDTVNATSRTIAIRATLPNPKLRLKTNMFAHIDLTGVPVNVLACPKSAIQERGGQKVVYVQSPGGYEEHAIEAGREFGDYVEVTAGLKEGELVATQGSLLLRTAMANKQQTQQ